MNTDTALLQRESDRKPIRVGMVGAGATGRAIALQLGTPVPGMRLVAIANRTPEHGERAFREGGFQEWRRAVSAREAEVAINSGVPVLTDVHSELDQHVAFEEDKSPRRVGFPAFQAWNEFEPIDRCQSQHRDKQRNFAQQKLAVARRYKSFG